MKKVQSQTPEKIDGEENMYKLNLAFSPNIIAQFCYYQGIDVTEFIDFETCSNEQLKEIIQEMTRLLIEVGEDYRESRK